MSDRNAKNPLTSSKFRFFPWPHQPRQISRHHGLRSYSRLWCAISWAFFTLVLTLRVLSPRSSIAWSIDLQVALLRLNIGNRIMHTALTAWAGVTPLPQYRHSASDLPRQFHLGKVNLISILLMKRVLSGQQQFRPLSWTTVENLVPPPSAPFKTSLKTKDQSHLFGRQCLSLVMPHRSKA